MPDTSYHSWTMPTVDGSTDTWGQILNDMFDNEIDADVERRGTLANRPAAVDVPNGAKYVVTSGEGAGTVYIESSDSWTEFGRFMAGGEYLVSRTTVSAIADAVSNYRYVRLLPGETYTHDGSSTISHGAGNGHQVVNARGATIEVRGNPVVESSLDNFNTDSFQWYGGVFLGTGSAGENAFVLDDLSFGVIAPKRIRDCDVGVALRNVEAFCEMTQLRFDSQSCNVPIALMGNASNAVQSVAAPSTISSSGTDSMRNTTIDIVGNPDVTGLHVEQARPYESWIHVSMSLDSGITGWRIDGGMNGTVAMAHFEAPGGASGGTGIDIVSWEAPNGSRTPAMVFTSRFADLTTDINNQTSTPLLHHRPSFVQDDGSGGMGTELWEDNAFLHRRRADGTVEDDGEWLFREGNLKVDAPSSEKNITIRDENFNALYTFTHNGTDGLLTTEGGNHRLLGFASGQTARPTLQFGHGDFEEGYSLLSSPPSNPPTEAVYFDDGTNTGDGNPGWRYTTDGGTSWTDVN